MQDIAPNLILTLIDEPLPIEYCPCCNKSLSNTLDWNIAAKLTAADWTSQSRGSIFINPQQPSLAVSIFYKEAVIITASLHKCGKHLHFHTPKFEERVSIKKSPSIRTQATKIVGKFVKDWAPGTLLIGTGDHDTPHLIGDFSLPKIWEKAT